MKQIIKDTLILFAITLIAGLLLGFVYDVTKQPIAKQEQITKENAFRAVFNKVEGVDSAELVFEEFDAETFKKVNENFEKLIAAANNTNNTLNQVVNVKKADGEFVGYAITVTNSEGYGGNIKLTVGIDAGGMVTGVSILAISETPGLGLNAKNESFIGQFAGVNTTAFVYTKNGKKADNEIDAITSATYTTKSVTNGVNAALSAVKAISETGGM